MSSIEQPFFRKQVAGVEHRQDPLFGSWTRITRTVPCASSTPRGIYTNDTGFFERMYDLWIIDTLPEEIAQQARPFFPAG